MTTMRRLMLKAAGEIGVKSPRTRKRFARILRENATLALSRTGVTGTLTHGAGRMLVQTPAPARARDALATVFGLHSVSDVEVLRYEDLEDLVAQAAGVFRDRVAGRTFAVRARRTGEQAFRSGDVNRELGTALLAHAAGVDLEDPEVEVPVEVVGDRALAVLETRPGPGGLPVGTEGRAAALFSGGFDSPVAAWLAMSRGLVLDLVVCDLGGCAQTESALGVARELARRWALGVEPRVHVVNLLPVLAVLTQRVDPRLRQVVLKRAMYRVGSLVAEEVGARALVTGESLGQASTQTLQNLSVAEEAAAVPVLRPLIGLGKEEIIQRARAIGTHAASERVKEYCSISTGPVETGARPERVAAAERDVDEALIRSAVSARRVVDLVEWRPGPLPGYVVETVPEGAVIVDVREHDEGVDVGDRRLPFSRAEEWMPTLERNATYLFVCSIGARSEMVAQALFERGFRAYCLAGGAHRLPSRAA